MLLVQPDTLSDTNPDRTSWQGQIKYMLGSVTPATIAEKSLQDQVFIPYFYSVSVNYMVCVLLNLDSLYMTNTNVIGLVMFVYHFFFQIKFVI